MSTVVLKIRSIFRKSQHRFVSEFRNCASKLATPLHGLFSPHANQNAVKAKRDLMQQPWGDHLTLGLNSHRKAATIQRGISLTKIARVSVWTTMLTKEKTDLHIWDTVLHKDLCSETAVFPGSCDHHELTFNSDLQPFTHTQSLILSLSLIGLLRASLVVKNLPAKQETCVWSSGQEDLLEKEMAIHFSILAWEIPWTKETGGLLVGYPAQRVAKSRTPLSD